MTEQLTLFNLAPQQTIKTVHDPYWDEIVLSPGKVEETGQLSLLYDDAGEPPEPDEYPTIAAYESAWAAWERRFPHLVQFVKGMSDIPPTPSSPPSPPTPLSPFPSPQSLTPVPQIGDWVKLCPNWMNESAAKAGQFKQDYEFESEDDLVRQVIWVDSRNGNIYVGGKSPLYVPRQFYICNKTDRTPKTIDTVLEQTTERCNPDSTVLEQAATDTREPAPEQCHWTEEYKVKRYHQEHKYYRYIWMSGRKLHHIHIPGGNVKSTIAIGRKEEVERAIASGEPPAAIEKLIRSWR